MNLLFKNISLIGLLLIILAELLKEYKLTSFPTETKLNWPLVSLIKEVTGDNKRELSELLIKIVSTI